MKSIDDFDGFLKTGFLKIDNKIADDGFTDKVLSNLPVVESSLKRNLILYLACTISVLIFIISGGYKSLLLSVNDILRDGFHSIKPSLVSLVVILVFIGVSFCIARTEHDKNIV
jgi:hypothetical protein